MIISLYLDDKILNFKLPTIVSGSYTFDFKETDGSLINVDGKNDKWVLYQTNDVKVVKDSHFVKSVELESNNFYIVQRDGVNYLLYVYDVNKTNIISYEYDKTTDIKISSSSSANFYYNCNWLGNGEISINCQDGINVDNSNGAVVYVNKFRNKNKNFKLKPGDTLEIYGLRILFLGHIVLINNMYDKLTVNQSGAKIKPCVFIKEDAPQDIDVKNEELYNQDNYFQKSPRLRRNIEEKKIRLTPPPQLGENYQLPLILTIGPMLTMAITSIIMISNIMIKITNKETTLKASWPQLVVSIVMIASMMVWPIVTQKYNKKMQEKRKKEIHDKYTKYLDTKRKDLEEEKNEEKIILYENLITIQDCLNILETRTLNFWDKRIDQSDFLNVRIGVGKEKLKAQLDYSEEDFKMDENDLRDEADKLSKEYEYIDNVPVGYSFYENVITDIMGKNLISINFTNNIILQLLTFYSYEDLKLMVFTSEARANNWEYIKYLNHNFSNNKDFRFFSTNAEDAKVLSEYINYEINDRLSREQKEYKPHYFIIIDGYDNPKQFEFVNRIADTGGNIGFSIVILENRMTKLPSKCNNFIIIDEKNSTLLKNSYEKQEQIPFKQEVKYNIDMLDITKKIANVPIEFSDAFSQLPESISFLEMEHVGKVDQLNILNRWSNNDSTRSLRAEIGVDANGDLMYLDLHEKAHGPHGLIAGTTGSGKSEFIITYILSMAINYSPDDVSFILIDYKGGGLALAFENKVTGISLPHLAGTITNLDKDEMNRTLVSIDSEVKRRQKMFNDARVALGESTIDIYKYQQFYKEGKLEEPIPHLLIICDEFAELKAQQPEFMDNLISVARIGRSLGIHLILATQKPSGVVNEQIWSNSRFKVCLRVQDESDSKEMLKRPDAAYIKESGRYFLQVGFDEFFDLGQSGWCGANYYPSDKVIKQVDKSVSFINNCGAYIRSIQASNSMKIEAQGDQLTSILKAVIDVANMVEKRSKKLWLENLPDIITCKSLENKYSYYEDKNDMDVVLGEYDAPEKQTQGVVKYNFIKDGNTLVYGNDGSEVEMLLNTLVYQTSKHFTSKDVNFYIIDYGSETFRKYKNLPHVGGVVFQSDEEEFGNLLKMIKEEINKRKKLFAEYSGQYTSYVENSGHRIPLKVIIINNYDSLYSSHQEVYDILPELVRDSERYGIIFWITGNAINSIHSKISKSCLNYYAFKLKDITDYSVLFGKKLEALPTDIKGRGVLKHDRIHNFQVASIVSEPEKNDEYLLEYIKAAKEEQQSCANKIPVLPNKVRLENVRDSIKSLSQIPVGISKKDLEVITVDYTANIGNIITSNKLANTEIFTKSLITTLSYFKGLLLVVIDPTKMLGSISNRISNYFVDDFDNVTDTIINLIKKYVDSKSNISGIIFIQGLSKYVNKLSDKKKIADLFDLLKAYEKITLIAADTAAQLKSISFESWFTQNFILSEGIWIGKGIADQSILRMGTVNKQMTLDYGNDMGFVINEGVANLVKFIDFISEDSE